MPISLTCSCGKGLRVKDEWVGKTAKCPQCGNTFVVPAHGGPVGGTKAASSGPIGAGTLWSPKQRVEEKEGLGSKFALSRGVIIFLVLFITIPTLIFLVRIGPVAAQKKWKAMEEEVESDIRDVVTKAMLAESEFNTADMRNAPSVSAVTFDTAILTHVPEIIKYSGRSSNGFFNGTYNTKTKEVVADVPRSSFSKKDLMHVTGRRKGSDAEVEVDGKVAKLIFRPKGRDADD